MTLYELLMKISYILAKNNADKLFEYIIHSMDYNGGFLRSRYCYRDKTLSDFECGDDLKTILVTLRTPFDFYNSTNYYEENNFANSPLTLLKMQIFLYDLSNKENLNKEIMWSCSVDFSYPIMIDLIDESFEILPAASLSTKIGIKKTNALGFSGHNKKAKGKEMSKIIFSVPKGNKDIIKAHTEKQDESLNGFITRAIDEAMKRDSSSEPGTTETEDDISAIQAARMEYKNGETVIHNAIDWD